MGAEMGAGRWGGTEVPAGAGGRTWAPEGPPQRSAVPSSCVPGYTQSFPRHCCRECLVLLTAPCLNLTCVHFKISEWDAVTLLSCRGSYRDEVQFQADLNAQAALKARHPSSVPCHTRGNACDMGSVCWERGSTEMLRIVLLMNEAACTKNDEVTASKLSKLPCFQSLARGPGHVLVPHLTFPLAVTNQGTKRLTFMVMLPWITMLLMKAVHQCAELL